MVHGAVNFVRLVNFFEKVDGKIDPIKINNKKIDWKSTEKMIENQLEISF